VEEAPEAPRTYQRPKVDRFSRDGEGIALHGYDVVSYQEKRAEKGTAEWVAEYGGIRWRFTSERHREEFQKHPESYLPEYGGFCAYSVGRGYPATADPRAFVVDRGKLYLFFDRAVQAVWEQDRARLVDAADRNWPKLHREP
jgi:YHS domain-containing protein